MADRIQARAVRRAQELLKQVPVNDGVRHDRSFVGAHEAKSRRQAAHDAGLSDHQYRTAMAVGDIPQADFDADVVDRIVQGETTINKEKKRLRAERRLGQIEQEQAAAGLLNKGGRPSLKPGAKTNPVSMAPTLKEVGLDKRLADRVRKMAAVPEDKFESMVGAATRDSGCCQPQAQQGAEGHHEGRKGTYWHN